MDKNLLCEGYKKSSLFSEEKRREVLKWGEKVRKELSKKLKVSLPIKKP
jgi:hypothetical protein